MFARTDEQDFFKIYHAKKNIFRPLKDPAVTCSKLQAFCKQGTEIQIGRLNN